MPASTSRPRVALVVSPDAHEQVAELPDDDSDNPTTWEGCRWEALRAFARREGVQLPPPSPVVFVAAVEPAIASDCALCARPIEMGARVRLDAVLPTTFVHEACRLHEHLAEWSSWQKRNK